MEHERACKLDLATHTLRNHLIDTALQVIDQIIPKKMHQGENY